MRLVAFEREHPKRATPVLYRISADLYGMHRSSSVSTIGQAGSYGQVV